MPEGSSSAAPVIRPGPREPKKRCRTFFFIAASGRESGSHVCSLFLRPASSRKAQQRDHSEVDRTAARCTRSDRVVGSPFVRPSHCRRSRLQAPMWTAQKREGVETRSTTHVWPASLSQSGPPDPPFPVCTHGFLFKRNGCDCHAQRRHVGGNPW